MNIQQKGNAMKNFFPVIENSQLFSGITEENISSMLCCLDAKTEDFPKGAYILRTGDTVEALGLMLSGSALIIQEDFWGNRNIMSSIVAGQSFAAAFACAPHAVLNVSVAAEASCSVMFLNVKRVLTVCPSTCAQHSRIIQNLISDMAEKNLRFNEKLTHLGQRTTRAKLLSYLSSEAQRRGAFGFDIPFSRQQLADYLSVERSGLSLELCKMRDEGLLEFKKSHFSLKR